MRPDELHLTFNFRLVEAPTGRPPSFIEAIDGSLAAMAEVGAPCTWVLSNHDVVRHATRYGGGAMGPARARAAALVSCRCPGAAYVYNGDELGLQNVDLPDEVLQDPTWERSGHTERGRDGERVPLPWAGTEPPFGFGVAGQTWLPMPAELGDADRRGPAGRPGLHAVAVPPGAAAAARADRSCTASSFDWLQAPDGCLAYRRGPNLVVALNAGEVPVELPPGEVLLSSSPIEGDKLPANTAVWLRF